MNKQLDTTGGRHFDIRFGEPIANHWTDHGQLISEAVFCGKHTGPFLGIAPTQNEVSYRFLLIVIFKDELLASERFYFDVQTILDQIQSANRG